MAHVRRHPKSGRWQVRYRDPTGRERSKTFERKTDADRFAAGGRCRSRRLSRPSGFVRARRAGILSPPAGHGRSGGSLTSKGLMLLNQQGRRDQT